MKHTDIVDLFKKPEFLGKKVTVCGWVRTSRESKNVAFLELNDGTSLKSIQIVVDKASPAAKALDSGAMDLGAALLVEGEVVASQNSALIPEINARSIRILGDCPVDYPLQKKRHGMEFLRTIPSLRVRTNTFNALLRVRSILSDLIHQYFLQNNYVYVHTPIITGSDCEGAGEVFRVTTHDFGAKHKTAAEYYADDFFGKKAGLTVSGQLEGEVAAMAMGKIYTFGPTFRAEKSNTTRHAAEFWQIEPEVAFAELPDIMETAEEMIKFLIAGVMERCGDELKFFDAHFEAGLIEKLKSVQKSAFGVLEYTEAIELLKKAKADFKYPVEWGLDLQTEHERYLTEEIFKKPLFVINYPKKLKSFYMKQNPDGLTVAATDLLVPGIGEIIGCSERENEYDKLLEAITVRGMNQADYTDYLALRRFGSCPHSGFGLGLERFLMYVTGINNIRDVILFPRTLGELR